MQLLLVAAHLLKAGLIAHLSAQSPQAHARVQATPPFAEGYQNHTDLRKSRERIPKYVFWLQLQI